MKKSLIKISSFLTAIAIPFTASASYLAVKNYQTQEAPQITPTTKSPDKSSSSTANTSSRASNQQVNAQAHQELWKLLQDTQVLLVDNNVQFDKSASQLSKKDLKLKYSLSSFGVLKKENVTVSFDLLSNKNFKTTFSSKNMLKYVNDLADNGKAVVAVYATYNSDKGHQSIVSFKEISGFKKETNKTELINVESIYPAPKETDEFKVVTTRSLEEINKYLQDNSLSASKNPRLPIVSVQHYNKYDDKDSNGQVVEFGFGFSRFTDAPENKIFTLKKDFYDKIQLVGKNGEVDTKANKNNKYILAEYNMKNGVITLFIKKKDGTSTNLRIVLK
ncbi:MULTISPECIES: hypothetical protein [unclassified Mycoplasma]|uniref:hypothetical protein n=1 Tax=unclassified Mycoplasma TaxID=2683645 RepID=UPI00211BF11D|nr:MULTISPECIES: hypothetical protein [unclassified Mycoplasma]UUM19524.1 hypothetical protein NPA11_01945 [Mycoplasma sp. 1578d]UUM24444.1 hypothetical protein NPA12_01920 [Mycoplasma sp. 3686d]